jgi:hypothetical protein
MLRLRFVVNQEKSATKESMNAILKSTGLTALLIAVALLAGCASDQTETKAASNTQMPDKNKASYKDRQYAANPSKVKFSEFKSVELKETVINPEENGEGNRKQAKKIDEMLLAGLKGYLPDLKVIPAGGDFSKSDQRTLQIAPRIDHIRIVGPGGRFWLGPMAGGSDIVMHVDYRDSSTGEIIANPDFWKGNNAWAGNWSMGATDNQIRDAVVAQIIGYTLGNK